MWTSIPRRKARSCFFNPRPLNGIIHPDNNNPLRRKPMSGLKKYLLLPPEVTAFEQGYLTKLNKIALYFFYAHIPVFMLVAWVAGTGPLSALLLPVGQ